MELAEKKTKQSLLTPNFTTRFLFFLSADFILFFVSLFFAYALRFDFNIPPHFMSKFYIVFATLVVLKWGSFYLFGIYRMTWRFFGLHDAKNLFYALAVSFLAFFILYSINTPLFSPMPRSVIGTDLVLSFLLVGALRFSKRLLIESSKIEAHKPTLIVGISANTANLIKSMVDSELSNDYYPIGIIAIQEKNYNLIGSTVQNIKIAGTSDIPFLIESKQASAAIIDGSLPSDYLQKAYQILSNAGISDIKRSTLLSDGKESITSLSVEELLARHPKDLDTQTVEDFIRGKNVLITGAGGSIGSEIAVQCHQFGAAKLLLIDHSEFNLYQIGEQIPSAELYLCNIIDKQRLDSIIQNGSVDIVIHAAAYKHVPLCEANIQTAIMNNVVGSRNVIDSAIEHNVPKIVIISTDKAVRPTNVMGTTKRIVELYAQNVDPKNSEIVAVRFGNVLGSSGSVIPKFKSQIEAGGPITLTHPDITRYFMLISEACQLVLQASAIARGGELFILDMGESVKIADLAHTMIRLYATQPIEIVYTGLRPGEKLYEELLIDDSEQKTSYESIMIARSTPYPIETLKEDIEKLVGSDNAIEALQKIVPEFQPSGK
ncbi:nucleoside-diphosphate sugar epimerase/dehydratase [Sulfuricurvum sp.]|uniref:UDP-N-acetylglucosamine 4,6-dehydratase family protein n=1 Tax=Sulfuricurvum sp. TaxID=2025608 RepID=UPI002E344713|nr:nucleoside-diphosphate sugar epimerase/dehydratase [Sulfuricurvum sp.]HEX5328701.1 nucleoside-diphosphate sugar epimerase/dehydratase [Sulfuricurvum sp.]